MRVVFIRLGKGLPAEAEQRSALAADGVADADLTEAWVEPAPRKGTEPVQWGYMLGALREGDTVAISRPAVLAPTEREARERLAALTERGAVLRIASTGRSYRWHPDAAEALQLALDVRADERSLAMGKARAGLKALGRKKFEAQQWKEAKRLWSDPAVTAEAAAERSGIGMRTLYRKYGPKGTPAFGRVKGRKK